MTDTLNADTAVGAPTHCVDTVSRVAIWERDDLPWPDVTVHSVKAGAQPASPYRITAVFIGQTSPRGVVDYRASVHVECRVRGKSGHLIDDYRSLYLTTEQDPDEWVGWIRTAVDLAHPARGGRDQDPTGSYL